MRAAFITVAFLFCASAVSGRILRVPLEADSAVIELEGYVDVYFGYNINRPPGKNRPYLVSHARHNEVNLNLAYLSLKWTGERSRARFSPGAGTYMNANYAAEPATLRSVLEASVGLRPWKSKGVWIDAGVFPAPFTAETAVAHDQLLYTRSFAAEFSPYFLTGIRTTLPVGRTLSLAFYVVNGWQVIQDVNGQPAFAASLEWKPSEHFLANWSAYAGDERSPAQPAARMRWFSDLYATWQINPLLSLAADVYAGRQSFSDSAGAPQAGTWYQANVNARYIVARSQSVASRAEYFRDRYAVLAVPVTPAARFDCASFSLGYRADITSRLSFHAEVRYFRSSDQVFYDRGGRPAASDLLLISGLTARF